MIQLLTAMAVLATGPALVDAAPYGGPPRPGPEPAGQLTLSYMADAGFASAVKLTCAPDGGGHPDPGAACAVLARHDADPDRMTPASTACVLIYAPITAEITGWWKGAAVRWTHRYGNACEMRRATGVLFTF